MAAKVAQSRGRTEEKSHQKKKSTHLNRRRNGSADEANRDKSHYQRCENRRRKRNLSGTSLSRKRTTRQRRRGAFYTGRCESLPLGFQNTANSPRAHGLRPREPDVGPTCRTDYRWRNIRPAQYLLTKPKQPLEPKLDGPTRPNLANDRLGRARPTQVRMAHPALTSTWQGEILSLYRKVASDISPGKGTNHYDSTVLEQRRSIKVKIKRGFFQARARATRSQFSAQHHVAPCGQRTTILAAPVELTWTLTCW